VGEVLGIGLSHYPPLCGLDAGMAEPLSWALDDPAVPSDRKDPANWPVEMQDEWKDPTAAAAAHRAELREGFARCRTELDDFAPDVVLIFGDDQYENFREDIIPPFAVLAYDELVARPWSDAQHSSVMAGKPNVWGEPRDTEFVVRTRPDVARELVAGLLDREIDVAYAYRPLHHESLPHSFMNTLLFLDYDRRGFEHAIVPFAINCYGRTVIGSRGLAKSFGGEYEPDPPSPSPKRMMDVGAAVADVVAEMPLRVALVATSSWSHAFLCDKTWRMMPDVAADLRLYDDMLNSRYGALAQRTLAEIEEAGQQETLNWFTLFGAMRRLDRSPRWSTFVGSYIFNSNKVFAVY
jgi:hypothetical protein